MGLEYPICFKAFSTIDSVKLCFLLRSSDTEFRHSGTVCVRSNLRLWQLSPYPQWSMKLLSVSLWHGPAPHRQGFFDYFCGGCVEVSANILSATLTIGPSDRIAARSMIFFNSRTFLGQCSSRTKKYLLRPLPAKEVRPYTTMCSPYLYKESVRIMEK